MIGKPHMTAFAVTSSDSDLDILALADVMEEKGWTTERQQKPHSLHFTIMPHHVNSVEQFLRDFRLSADLVKVPNARVDLPVPKYVTPRHNGPFFVVALDNYNS